MTAVNDAPVRDRADYVLYWMTAFRRPRWNFALEHAAFRAAELGLPLVVLEALRCDYRWASDRLHAFVLDGMADNARAFAAAGVRYHAYVEPERGAGKGLLATLGERAAVVVTDEFPCFFLPRMVAAAGEQLDVRLEQVDGNGLVPLRVTDRAFPTAHSFRRFLQKHLREHLEEFPAVEPLTLVAGGDPFELPAAVVRRWPAVPAAVLDGDRGGFLSTLPIDHDVPPVAERGGHQAGEARLSEFVVNRLERYAEDRNDVQQDAASGLSPYLHFGHVSSHHVVAAALAAEGWTPDGLAIDATGSRSGWWGASPGAEAFLDQIVTWRELGFVFCFHRPDDYDAFESLPDWARQTLAEQESCGREHVHSAAEFEAAETGDELWNAAQNQLRREGKIHNYLRMLWGKKILEWSATPRDALDVMIELNNKYALDGRNPNSYSGIFWTLGRFDRPWGPKRPVYGSVRFMSSANTARKMRVKEYVEEFGQAASQGDLFG